MCVCEFVYVRYSFHFIDIVISLGEQLIQKQEPHQEQQKPK